MKHTPYFTQRKMSFASFFKLLIFTIWLFIPAKSTAQSRVEIGVNKNVELIMAMQVLTDMDSLILSSGFSGFPITTRLDFTLKNEYFNFFSPYKMSEPIKYFNQLITKGFIFGLPLTIAVLSDEELCLTNTCWIETLPSPPYPADFRYKVEGFLEMAKHFMEISGFENFFNSNLPVYDNLVTLQQNKISLESLVCDMERFFNKKLTGYHIVLVPLMWPGGMSLSSKEPCYAEYGETWILIGPKQVVNGLPDFGTIDEYSSVVVHEFCHAFIAPVCDKYKEKIMQFQDLYASEQKVFRRNGIHNWLDAVNELITRSAEIIITSGGDQKMKESKLLMQTKELGFRYLPELVQAIDKNCYQLGKDFEEAFPEIIATFNKIKSQQHIDG